MSSRWNFPAGAELSYESSVLSQAKLGHLNFWAETTGVRQHCYKKKAATVGQNGRLSALCNFFSFWLVRLWGTTYEISDHAAQHNFISKIWRPIIKSEHLWVCNKIKCLTSRGLGEEEKFLKGTEIMKTCIFGSLYICSVGKLSRPYKNYGLILSLDFFPWH